MAAFQPPRVEGSGDRAANGTCPPSLRELRELAGSFAIGT